MVRFVLLLYSAVWTISPAEKTLPHQDGNKHNLTTACTCLGEQTANMTTFCRCYSLRMVGVAVRGVSQNFLWNLARGLLQGELQTFHATVSCRESSLL